MTASNQKTVTLTASTVATITFATRYNYLVIENLEQTTVSDTMIIYGAEGGVVPTIAGDDLVLRRRASSLIPERQSS
jgi:hypothetical protein